MAEVWTVEREPGEGRASAGLHGPALPVLWISPDGQQELGILPCHRQGACEELIFTVLVQFLSVLNSFPTSKRNGMRGSRGAGRLWTVSQAQRLRRCGWKVGDQRGWGHFIQHTHAAYSRKGSHMQRLLGKVSKSPKGKQEVPNAHEHAALEHVSTVQPGRSCLRVTKRFHDGKLSALHSSKAVSLTLESLSLFLHLQNGPPNPPYLTKPSVFERYLNLRGRLSSK